MAETLSAAYGTPATLDQLDGGGAGTVYMLGNEVDVDEDGGSATHVTWYAPASAPGVTCIAKVYRVSDTAEVATSDGAGFTPTPGGTNQIALVTPFSPDDGEDYVACVLTRRYTFTGSAAFPFASAPAQVMHARRGRFKITTAGNPVFPDQQANTTNFHVGLVFVRPAAPPVEGTFQAIAPAAVLAGTGALINPGVVSFALSGFSLSGTGLLINSGTVQLVAPMPVLAGSESASVLTPAGAPASTLTAAGSTVSTLTASGL